MTNFGKLLSIGIVVVILAVVIWFVARKPAAEITSMPEQNQSVQTQETAGTNQSLDEDMTSIEVQMNALDNDAAAASQAE